MARSIKDKETESFALSKQASLLLSLNQPAEGLEPAEEALRLAQGFPEREITALYTLGKVHRDLGEIAGSPGGAGAGPGRSPASAATRPSRPTST